MKKLVLLVCLFLIPLTLVSETQHRFRVSVYVIEAKDGDDPHIRTFLEKYLKKAFSSLEDVDIVESDEAWHFEFEVCYLENNSTDGRKTGDLSIADVFYERIPHSYFKAERYLDLLGSPVYSRRLGVAFCPRHRVEAYCAERVKEIDKEVLTPIRELLR